jgi:hypothetical protein
MRLCARCLLMMCHNWLQQSFLSDAGGGYRPSSCSTGAWCASGGKNQPQPQQRRTEPYENKQEMQQAAVKGPCREGQSRQLLRHLNQAWCLQPSQEGTKSLWHPVEKAVRGKGRSSHSGMFLNDEVSSMRCHHFAVNIYREQSTDYRWLLLELLRGANLSSMCNIRRNTTHRACTVYSRNMIAVSPCHMRQCTHGHEDSGLT